jgi:hypothetical protein
MQSVHTRAGQEALALEFLQKRPRHTPNSEAYEAIKRKQKTQRQIKNGIKSPPVELVKPKIAAESHQRRQPMTRSTGNLQSPTVTYQRT